MLVVSATCLLGGCERKISDANLKVIRPDMTTKEVESILGAPTRIETKPDLVSREVKTLPVTRYVYEQNGKKIELTFVGDRLGSGSDVGKSSEATPADPAALPKKKNEAPAISGSLGN